MRFFCGFGDASFQNFHVGENQFGIDGFNIGQRVDFAVYVNDVIIFETPDYVDDGGNLSDVAEEFVSQSFTLGSALYQAGDIAEFDGGVDGFL